MTKRKKKRREIACFKQQAAYLNRVSNGNSINAVLRAMNTIDLKNFYANTHTPKKFWHFPTISWSAYVSERAIMLGMETHTHTHTNSTNGFGNVNFCSYVCGMKNDSVLSLHTHTHIVLNSLFFFFLENVCARLFDFYFWWWCCVACLIRCRNQSFHHIFFLAFKHVYSIAADRIRMYKCSLLYTNEWQTLFSC